MKTENYPDCLRNKTGHNFFNKPSNINSTEISKLLQDLRKTCEKIEWSFLFTTVYR